MGRRAQQQDRKLEIDVILDARQGAAELAELGRQAEAAGIRGVWVSSLLDSRDPFTNLSVLATHTERLLLGAIAVAISVNSPAT